ncbi:MAG TPA: hypothetical protein VGO53_01580 [Steroidobacteraceae bacterium]|jgi:hypothetical protein|nr:hypothetical protein [Steroidobacteraceae bacterium]
MEHLDPRVFTRGEVEYLMGYTPAWRKLVKGAELVGFMLLGWCLVGAAAFLLFKLGHWS